MKHLLFVVLLIPSLVSSAELEKLTRLRDSYRAAVERANAPLQRSYTQELEKLKAEFMRASQLDDALAVDQELKDPEGKEAAARQRTALIDAVIGEPWRGQGGGTLTFEKDGKAQWDDTPCSWLFVSGESGDELVLFYKNLITNFNTVKVSDEGKKLSVIYKPTGKTAEFAR